MYRMWLKRLVITKPVLNAHDNNSFTGANSLTVVEGLTFSAVDLILPPSLTSSRVRSFARKPAGRPERWQLRRSPDLTNLSAVLLDFVEHRPAPAPSFNDQRPFPGNSRRTRCRPERTTPYRPEPRSFSRTPRTLRRIRRTCAHETLSRRPSNPPPFDRRSHN